MPDKKLIDNEIIKALQEMADYPHNYEEGQDLQNALDLITCQQAEYENLKVENQSLRTAANSLKMHYEGAQAKIKRLKESLNIELENFATEYDNKIKAEAYKECIKKVKNYIKAHCNPYGKPDFDYDTSIKILNFIDKLAKEMVGENND